jgi:hypothetical protein
MFINSPKLELQAHVQPITWSLYVELNITPDFHYNLFALSGNSESFWVFVEDGDGETLYQTLCLEKITVSLSYCLFYCLWLILLPISLSPLILILGLKRRRNYQLPLNILFFLPLRSARVVGLAAFGCQLIGRIGGTLNSLPNSIQTQVYILHH